jgi:hypothetical protein
MLGAGTRVTTMRKALALLCLTTPALAAGAIGVSDPPVIVKRSSTVREQGIDGVKGLRASFLVATPPEKVLATLWDVKRFPEIFPDIKEMKVLAQDEREARVLFIVDAVLAKVSYTLERKLHPEARAIRWREVDGDLQTVRGAWKVATGPTPGQPGQPPAVRLGWRRVRWRRQGGRRV